MEGRENAHIGRILEEIVAQMEEAGVDCSSLKIEMEKDGILTLEGEICSLKEKETVLQIIKEFPEVERIVDETIISEGIMDEDEGREENSQIEEEDDSDTEDIYRSIEDGIPYTPPSEDTAIKDPGKIIRKNRKKKSK